MDIYEIGLVITIPNFIFLYSSYKSFDFEGFSSHPVEISEILLFFLVLV